jgi:phosphoglycerol transferase MdoB-like AlkP superfamily enzyme
MVQIGPLFPLLIQKLIIEQFQLSQNKILKWSDLEHFLLLNYSVDIFHSHQILLKLWVKKWHESLIKYRNRYISKN